MLESEPRPNLPKAALLRLIDLLKYDRSYYPFQYIMYSEADNVVHLRYIDALFDSIDATQGNLVLVPHRMQTLPTALGLPRAYHHFFDQTSSLYDLDIDIITEKYYPEAVGSCCDAGRYVFADCGSWW